MSGDVAAVLDRAADLIGERGWTQGRAESATGVCVYKAIGLASSTEAEQDQATDALGLYVNWSYVPGWNDALERTEAEVLAALRAAAESERAS